MMAIADMIYIYAGGMILTSIVAISILLYLAKNLNVLKSLIDEKEIAAKMMLAEEEGRCHALTSYGERCLYPAEPGSHYCVIHKELEKIDNND